MYNIYIIFVSLFVSFLWASITIINKHVIVSIKSHTFLFLTTIFITVARWAIDGLIAGITVISIVILIKKLASLSKLGSSIAIVIFAFIASLLIVNFGSKIPIDVSKTFGKRGGSAFTQQLLTTGLEGSGDERAVARRQAINLLQNNKSAYIIGVGPGQFGPYVQNNTQANYGWTIVNNLTLELLLETGVIGLILILAFFGSVLIRAYVIVDKNKIDLQMVTLLAISGYIVTKAVQYQGFSTLYVVHIWVAVGILLGIILATGKTKIGP